MNHNIVSDPNNQEWLSVKEAAVLWGCSRSNMNKIILNNIDTYSSGIVIVSGKGRSGRQYRVNKQTLLIMRNVLNIGKGLTNSQLISGKKQIAEMAITGETNFITVITQLNKAVEQLTQDVKELKSEKQKHELSLELLPAPTREVPEMSTRAALNKHIRDAARRQNRAYNLVFNELYLQFYYRFRINLVGRATKTGMSIIEYAEQYDHIEDLYALARKIYT